MKILRFSFFILLVVCVFIACEKTSNTDYQIEITGVSSDYVSIDDTISIYVDWMNSEPTSDVKIFLDSTSIQIISVTDTIIKIKIPSGWDDIATVTIEHPNGAQNTWWGALEKEITAIIYTINPLTGVAGDEITIRGIDFLSIGNIEIVINTQECEINSISDSVIVFIVPDSCGNGPITMEYCDFSTSDNCSQNREDDFGIFTYNFPGKVTDTIITQYVCRGTQYTLERDAEGRVNKRITSSTIYETFSYNNNGYVDSIKLYNNDELSSYEVFARNSDNTQIEVTEHDGYHNCDINYEYHFLNNRIAQVNIYADYDTLVYLLESCQYEHNENITTETRKVFNSDGSIESESTSEMKYDIYNGTFPDLGIPGYIQYAFYEYPQITDGCYTYKTYYNDWGGLVKVKFYNCNQELEWLEYSFTYK